MSQTNRLQVAIVRETTAGTTPNTPRMRKMRVTGESLTFTPQYIDPEEIRDDRMTVDPILVMKESGGALPVEFSYPVDESPLSEVIRSAMFNTWNNSVQRDNDGTADSVITDVATSGEIVTVTTGTAFVAKQLVRFTGFGVTGNNGVFKCTTGSATVPEFVGSGVTDEAAPAAAARMKVVGFIGDSGDINATATGVSSTTTNFTTLGLAVGMWLKIGGTGAGNRFVTEALNDWVRISAITATALTFDNRPSGWTTETGTGLTVKFWFGDYIKNGTTATSLTTEKAYLGQTTPVYMVNTGQQVNQLDVAITSRQTVKAGVTFMGMGGSESTTALDASPDAATTGAIMAANANCGRLAENGSALTSPNWARSFTFQINNNLRSIEDVTSQSPVAIRDGECTVTGRVETYFGSDTLLAKFYAGTATSLNSRVQKDSQAVIFDFPRVTYRGGGNPSAPGKNQDSMLPLEWRSSVDSTFNCHVQINRLEYYQA